MHFSKPMTVFLVILDTVTVGKYLLVHPNYALFLCRPQPGLVEHSEGGTCNWPSECATADWLNRREMLFEK